MMKHFGEKIIWLRVQEYLKKYQPLIIAVTGSTGKTLTKDAITLSLKGRHLVRSSPESYNTPIGVALAVLGLTAKKTKLAWFKLLLGSKIKEVKVKDPRIIVLELGADRPGDIDNLVKKLPISIGVITNVQSTHLEYFINKELVAHEKMSLVVSLPEEGTAILNADDELVYAMAEHTKSKNLFFGHSDNANVQLVRAERLPNFGLACEIKVRGFSYEVHLPNIVARHQVDSVLAALSVIVALEGDIKLSINNLQQLVPPKGRMRMLEGINKSRILDDTYNASPESTLVALDTLNELSARRRIAILGNMEDLGGYSITAHGKVGEKAAEVADVFITVGDKMREAGSTALKTNKTDVHHFDSSEDVGEWVNEFIQSEDLILVKGSRAMNMEEAIKHLLLNPEKDSNQLVG